MKKLIKRTSAEYGQFEAALNNAGTEYKKYSAASSDRYEYISSNGQHIEAITTANGVDGDCEIIEFYSIN